MYLDNFLRFHYLSELQGAKHGGFVGLDTITFKQYFDDLASAYELVSTSYIDHQLEYLTDLIWTLVGKEKTDGMNDLEFLDALVRRVFVELKDGTPGLEFLMSKLYWHFIHDDFESVWRCLVDYYNTAAGVQ